VVWLSAPSWAILAATVCTAKHMKEKGAGSQLPPKFRQLSLEIKNGGSVVFFFSTPSLLCLQLLFPKCRPHVLGLLVQRGSGGEAGQRGNCVGKSTLGGSGNGGSVLRGRRGRCGSPAVGKGF
jgi:hypothetical protein